MSERAQRVGVVVLVAIAVGLVFVASAVRSYVPLFFVWVPQLAIPVFLSRAGKPSSGEVSAQVPGQVAPSPRPSVEPTTDHAPDDAGEPSPEA